MRCQQRDLHPVPRARAARAAAVASALTLLFACPAAHAADLVEPWERGLTNAELFASFGDSSEDRETVGLVGFGLTDHLSLGFSFASPEGDDGSGGTLLLYTRSLGGWGDLDLFGELHVQAASMEAELGAAERAFGFEWSAPAPGERSGRIGGRFAALFGSTTPYLRFTAARSDGVTHVHPLVGLRLPVRGLPRLDLHLELSGEEPGSGPWPVHLAVGPNLLLGEGIELVPELAVIHDRSAGGETAFVGTVGLVVDPSRWIPFGTGGGLSVPGE